MLVKLSKRAIHKWRGRGNRFFLKKDCFLPISASSGVEKNTWHIPWICLSYTTTFLTFPNLLHCSRRREEHSKIKLASWSKSVGSKTFSITKIKQIRVLVVINQNRWHSVKLEVHSVISSQDLRKLILTKISRETVIAIFLK